MDRFSIIWTANLGHPWLESSRLDPKQLGTRLMGRLAPEKELYHLLLVVCENILDEKDDSYPKPNIPEKYHEKIPQDYQPIDLVRCNYPWCIRVGYGDGRFLGRSGRGEVSGKWSATCG